MTVKTLMLTLMLYLQMPDAAPELEVISDARMVELGQGTCRKKVPCWGLFHYADGKIYVSEKLDIYSDFGKSVIVHELRHHQQTLACGPLDRGPAWQDKFWARELDAYCTQHRYLKSLNSTAIILAPGMTHPHQMENACLHLWPGRIQC
jgi:hypothetical protein